LVLRSHFDESIGIAESIYTFLRNMPLGIAAQATVPAYKHPARFTFPLHLPFEQSHGDFAQLSPVRLPIGAPMRHPVLIGLQGRHALDTLKIIQTVGIGNVVGLVAREVENRRMQLF
jgi:hypothetical protein